MFASSPEAFAWQRTKVSALWNLCPINVVSANGRNASFAVSQEAGFW
jgi:hypothetical protein